MTEHPEAAHAASEFTDDDMPSRWTASTEMAEAIGELAVGLLAAVAVISFLAAVFG